VSQVVALHGGKVGYEAAPLGNNFYIILPLERDESGGPWVPSKEASGRPGGRT